MKPDDVVDLLPSKIVQMAAVGPYLHYLCEDGSTWMLVISSADESGNTRRRYICLHPSHQTVRHSLRTVPLKFSRTERDS